MSTSRPEADSEYSSRQRPSRGYIRRSRQRREGPSEPLLGARDIAGYGGILGALLLVVAEFLPLLRVHSTSYAGGVVKTITTGANHDYALIPIAVLAFALSLAARRGGGWAAAAGVAAMGVVALGVALLGDLPDAQATGLLGHAGKPFALAQSRPAAGLYVETLGAMILLLCGGIGALLRRGSDAGAALTPPTRGLSYRSPRSRAVGGPRVPLPAGRAPGLPLGGFARPGMNRTCTATASQRAL
jgi:hypothetical protein